MEDVITNVERSLFTSLRTVNELRGFIVQQYTELERRRDALAGRLRGVSASWEAELEVSAQPLHATFTELTTTASVSSSGDERGLQSSSLTKPIGGHGFAAGCAGAQSPQVSTAKEMGGLNMRHAPFASPLLFLPAPPLPSQQTSPQRALPSDLKVQTQALHARKTELLHASLVHAAKLEFAEEWTRVAVPWFDTVVCQRFFAPLQRRLHAMERRLARLVRRLRLDAPQYKLRTYHQASKKLSGACCSSEGVPSSISVLWSRYLHVMCQTPASERASSSLPSPCNEEDHNASNTGNETTAALVQTDTAVFPQPSHTHAPRAPDATQCTVPNNEEEVVIVPHLPGVSTALGEPLPHTRRSLRHIWHVMQYGLLGRGSGIVRRERLAEEDEGMAALPALGGRTCCADCDDRDGGDGALGCQVRELIGRYALLHRSTRPLHNAAIRKCVLLSPDGADSTASCGQWVAMCALSLLLFVEHACALHAALQRERKPASPQSTSSHQQCKIDAGRIAAVREEGGESCGKRCGKAASRVDATARHSLEEKVLLPVSLLLPLLQPLMDLTDDASTNGSGDMRFRLRVPSLPSTLLSAGVETTPPPSRCLSTTAAADYIRHVGPALDALLPLLHWCSLSRASCDCRCTYARLLRLRQLYRVPEPVQEREDSQTLVVLPQLSAEARLYRLRETEMQMRGQWEDVYARLLVARSLRSRRGGVAK